MKPLALTEPTLSLREEKKDNTRETIISVAEDMFLKRGYHETRIEDIAKTSHVSYRTIFNYFKSKEALLLAIVSDGKRYPQSYRPETPEPTYFDPRDAIPPDLDQRLERAKERRLILAMAAEYAGHLASEHTEIDIILVNRATRAQRIEAVQKRGGIRSDIPALEIATLFDIIRAQLTRHWLLTPGEDFEEFRTRFMYAIRVYLKGLEPVTAPPAHAKKKAAPSKKRG